MATKTTTEVESQAGPLLDITVKKADLVYALGRAIGAVGKASFAPICTCFLIDAFLVGRITASATDLEVSIISECRGTVEMGGAVAVPADRFYSVAKAAPGENITIRAIENFRLVVISGSYLTEIACMDPVDFPVLSEPEGAADIDFAAAPFQSMISANLHAVSTDPQKNTIAGLHLKREKDLLVGTATDGHRLSLAGKRLGDEVFISSNMFDAGVTIPRKGLEEIKKLTAGSVYIWHAGNNLIFSQTGVILIVRLVDGQFPDYRRVIPTDHPHRFIVNSGNLAAAVERVNILGDKKFIRLAYNLGNCCLGISTDSIAGEAIDQIDLVEWEGPEDFSIILTPKYLLEALASIGEDDIFIKFKDDMSPLVLFPSDNEKWDERLMLIVPRHS